LSDGHDPLAIGAERRDGDPAGVPLQYRLRTALKYRPCRRRPELRIDLLVKPHVPRQHRPRRSQPHRVFTVSRPQCLLHWLHERPADNPPLPHILRIEPGAARIAQGHQHLGGLGGRGGPPLQQHADGAHIGLH
jgi:hypothetical protein